MMKRFLTAWALGAVSMLMAWPLLAALSFTATVDRQEVTVNESFWLELRIEGTRSAIQPELDVLKEHFDVLRTSTEQSMRAGAGGTQASVAWRVELMARTAGDKQIPSFEQGGARTQPIAITVRPAPAATGEDVPAVYVEAELSKAQAYVGEQLILRTRLFASVPLTRGELSEPAADGLAVSRLGEDLSYVAQRNGKSYEVIERRYVIFAEQAAEVSISPIVFRGQTPVARRGNRGLSLFEQQRTLTAQSDPLAVSILPPPAGWRGPWLPAEKLRIEQQWTPSLAELKVGEPITRTVRVTMIGGMPARFADPVIASVPAIHSYPEKAVRQQAVTTDGLVLSWTQSIALVPSKDGEFQLPEVSLPWWRTSDGSVQMASLPALTLQVAAGEPPGPRSLMPSGPVATVAAASADTVDAYGGLAARQWALVAIVFALLWLLTLSVWGSRAGWWHRGRGGDTHNTQRLSAAARAISDACRGNDADAAILAWGRWAKARWPEAASHSLLATAQRLDDGDAQQALRELDRLRYGAAEAGPWDGKAHWAAVRRALPLPAEGKPVPESPLPPLHVQS